MIFLELEHEDLPALVFALNLALSSPERDRVGREKIRSLLKRVGDLVKEAERDRARER